jgi:hypothetical protein
LDLGERRFASLDAEARKPPQRGAFEPMRLGVANGEQTARASPRSTWGSSPAALWM